ncbi:hypothetical protein [Agrobacterium larrymoorei]|uniref:Uncharacterized protein n=1 Tax=Agrobacterium larrymoorei TaxID=160699 RepID=A0ABX8TH89_9HYPH|nr:hypothetical protein [Agrobacterium larrymoorei]QYA10565.1 hypothetical protein J5285_25575 [Agrobacterium larrymoorei]
MSDDITSENIEHNLCEIRDLLYQAVEDNMAKKGVDAREPTKEALRAPVVFAGWLR